MSTAAVSRRPSELENVGYEMFIVGLSLISVIDVLIEVLPSDPQAKVIAMFVDVPLTAVLLADFANRLLKSHPRRDYFITRFGWLDLLGSLPYLKVFRLFRVFRVMRMLRTYGTRAILRELMAHRAENALYIILFLVLVLLEFGSLFVLSQERSSPHANIKTGGDAIWWAFVSITTVGYGDYYPVTMWGRIMAVFVLAAGVGLFGALSGFLANFFLSPPESDAQTSSAPDVRDPLTMLGDLEAGLAAQMQAITAIRTALLSSAEGDDPA